MNRIFNTRSRGLALAVGLAAGAIVALAAAGAVHVPVPDAVLLAAGSISILTVLVLAGLDFRFASLSAAAVLALAASASLAVLLVADGAFAQSSLDSIVSGVEGKGNEVVSAGRRIAVIGLNIVFIAMGIAAMMRKISWGWFGLAVLGAILVNFSGQFSSWLGNFGGGLIPGLPGI